MNDATIDKLSQNPHYKMSQKQIEELKKRRMHNPEFDKHPTELELHDYEPIERTKKNGSRSKMPIQGKAPQNRQTNQL